MSREHDHIKLEALKLGVGDTVTTYCPYCRVDHEDKLSLTVTDQGIVYRCWRVSCGHKGFIPFNPGQYVPPSKAQAVKAKKFTGVLTDVPDWLFTELQSLYGLSPEDIISQGFRWAANANRIYMPNYDYYGRPIGHSVKGFGDYRGSKSYTFLDEDAIPLHFPINRVKSNRLVLVEDVLSSIKVGKVTSSAALLGTHITSKTAAYIRRHYDKVCFALDYDAVDKAVQQAKALRCLMSTEVVIFRKDPKDTPIEEIKEILKC